MDSKLLATIIIFPIWLVLVIAFRRHRHWFLYYLSASLGLSLMLVFLAQSFGIDQLMVNMASFHIELIGKYLFKIQMELMPGGRFTILSGNNWDDILKLGVECSAILESAIVVSLVIFYPIFNWKQKILRALFGLIVTYVINLVRLMIIVLMANRFGSEYVFLAHAGVARVFFFICELLLYWYLITKPTVKSVGDGISHNRLAGEEATVGRSLSIRYAVTQIIIIAIVLSSILTSFGISDQWKIAFSPVVDVNQQTPRPQLADQAKDQKENQDSKAILGEETNAISEILSSVSVVGLIPGQNSAHQIRIHQDLTIINFRMVSLSQPVTIELYLNGDFVNRTDIDKAQSDLELQNNIFQQNILTMANDIIELRVLNRGEVSSDTEINIVGYPQK